MKKTEKITLKLRDAYGKEYPVKVNTGDLIIIDVYAKNMVMDKPFFFDTNKEDVNKKFKYDGGMDFKATLQNVAKFNAINDTYDAQKLCHRIHMRENRLFYENLGKEESADEGK